MTPEHQEIFRDLCTKVDDRSVLDAAIEHIAQLKADNKRLRDALEDCAGWLQFDHQPEKIARINANAVLAATERGS